MPRAAASRITSTGKCFFSSHSKAWGARLSAAKASAMSRTAIWSSVKENWFMVLNRHDKGASCTPTLDLEHLSAKGPRFAAERCGRGGQKAVPRMGKRLDKRNGREPSPGHHERS